jgi:hypothetical protein
MASPLLGIAGVNSLLFAAYGISKRIISPFGQLSLRETAAAGAMAGAANAILASPVEMFKVRMQGQYGNPSDKRLRVVVREMWAEWGFRRGVMRGYWVRPDFCRRRRFLSRLTFCSISQGYRGERDSSLCRVSEAYNQCCPTTNRLYSLAELGRGVGSIQVRSGFVPGFECQKSCSVRILEAQICEKTWPRPTSVGSVG